MDFSLQVRMNISAEGSGAAPVPCAPADAAEPWHAQ